MQTLVNLRSYDVFKNKNNKLQAIRFLKHFELVGGTILRNCLSKWKGKYGNILHNKW